MKVRKIEISPKTIVFTVLFLISIAFFWQIRDILVMIFISFVLMHAIDPLVHQLQKIKIPRVLSIVIVYILVFGVIGFCVAGIIPLLVEQTTGLINSLPQIAQNIKIFGQNSFFTENNIDLTSQFSFLSSVPSNITKIAISIVSNIFSCLPTQRSTRSRLQSERAPGSFLNMPSPEQGASTRILSKRW